MSGLRLSRITGAARVELGASLWRRREESLVKWSSLGPLSRLKIFLRGRVGSEEAVNCGFRSGTHYGSRRHNQPTLRHRPTELQEKVSCMRVLPLKDSLWGSLSGQRGRFVVIESPAGTDDHRAQVAQGLAKWRNKGPRQLRQAFRWPNSVPFMVSEVDLCLDFAYRA
ncbi:hypothetical protein CEXT_5521 [Caerostris extrusa]|uniref:Uncharacterized protein n=1 Tax=Caerostris extrusa TaxID=172846 RepID=A0AAV4XLC8_CAEEX|nr:hypothetical protein CEXT_5521 [Caerostris extrusa]